MSPPILLDKLQIQSHLRHPGVSLQVLDSTMSTQEVVKAWPMMGSLDIAVCLAETQLTGHGQRGKSWHSPFGENIYLSMRCIINKAPHQLSGLSLVIGMALCQAIESFATWPMDTLSIKWPNDVFMKGKKLAGILIDTDQHTPTSSDVIIGVGLNVNMQQTLTEAIDQPWISLSMGHSQDWDRNPLSAALINHLIDNITQFSAQGLSDFMDEWRRRDHLYQKPLHVIMNNQSKTGIGQGIDHNGHLKIKTPSGDYLHVASGTVSILKPGAST